MMSKYRKQQLADVERFNSQHPVGTMVRYWKGPRSGPACGEDPTRAPAELLRGKVAVVWVLGQWDRVALSHIQVCPPDGVQLSDPEPHQQEVADKLQAAMVELTGGNPKTNELEMRATVQLAGTVQPASPARALVAYLCNNCLCNCPCCSGIWSILGAEPPNDMSTPERQRATEEALAAVERRAARVTTKQVDRYRLKEHAVIKITSGDHGFSAEMWVDGVEICGTVNVQQPSWRDAVLELLSDLDTQDADRVERGEL